MLPVVIIGGGHNGLTAAYYLAKAGHKPLVIERRPIVGGAAVTEEFAPGFRGPTLAHATDRFASRSSATWGCGAAWSSSRPTRAS